MLSTSAVNRIAINGDKPGLQKWIENHHASLDIHDDLGRTPLIYSILGNRVECVEMLLKAGASPNTADSSGRSPLHWTAQKGSVQCAKLLLSKGALLNLRDFNGMTPLHLAARNQSHRMFLFLVKCLMPGEIDDQDSYKRTALHWSALHGNAYNIKLLVKHGANVGIPDIEGKTPLHWAASCKTPAANQCVKVLLEHAPNIVNWQDYEGRTALHLAVADGTKTIVDSLISADKCNLNPMDNMFRTPLHWAAVLGHASVVNLLLERKVDCTSSDANGATPLHYAAQNNCAETVDAFLSNPNVMDEPDLQGRKALLWAAGKGANDVIKVMHKHCIKLSCPDKNGVTALHVAALSGHVSTCQLLVELTNCIEAQDLTYRTPLLYACEMGHADVVQALLDLKANGLWLDIDGKLALHWAAIGGHTYVVQILLTHGLDANTQDLFGRTALHCAAFGGYADCISVLLENGARSSLQDHEGMTALHWACSNGHMSVVQLLLDGGMFPNHMAFTDERYTPLDLALLGEHYDVAQCMMEHGGISINRIQHMAATKIQAYYRGYSVRKNFNEQRKLLVRHEQLKRQRAETDAIRCKGMHGKCSRDIQAEFVVPEKLHLERYKSLTSISEHQSTLALSLNNDRGSKNYHLESGLLYGENISDDSEDDETVFEHLEARGIKLNRKRFPGRPNSSEEIPSLPDKLCEKSLRGYDIIAATEALEKMLEYILECDISSNHVLSSTNKYNEMSVNNSENVNSKDTCESSKVLRDRKFRHSDFAKFLCFYDHDSKKVEKTCAQSKMKEAEMQKSYLGILKMLRKKFGKVKDENVHGEGGITDETNSTRIEHKITDTVDVSNLNYNLGNTDISELSHSEEEKICAARIIQLGWKRYRRKKENIVELH